MYAEAAGPRFLLKRSRSGLKLRKSEENPLNSSAKLGNINGPLGANFLKNLSKSNFLHKPDYIFAFIIPFTPTHISDIPELYRSQVNVTKKRSVR